METLTPEQAPELAPGQVIAWLRSDEGERWSRSRRGKPGGGITRHDDLSGVFGDVIRQPGGGRAAHWPEPGPWVL